MKRRNFITASAAAFPLLALGHKLPNPTTRTPKSFVVKANQSRFEEKTSSTAVVPITLRLPPKIPMVRLVYLSTLEMKKEDLPYIFIPIKMRFSLL